MVGFLQVGTMIWQAKLLRGTLEEIHIQAGHMGTQTTVLSESVAVAKKAADAAEKSAIAAMGVAIPTLMLQEFTFVPREDRGLEDSLLWPTVMIAVKNYGQSAAIMRSFAVEFACGDLPSELRYPSLLHFDSGTAVETGEVFRLEEFGITSWRGFSREEASAIAQDSKTLTVYGCVWYDDIFGSPTHKLVFAKWGIHFEPDGKNTMWVDCANPYDKESQNPN